MPSGNKLVSAAKTNLIAELSVPSKTFLLGEYLAVFGDPSLLVSTGPRFSLRVFEEKAMSPFHPDSPAGRLMAEFEGARDYSFEFKDPYQNSGGMGVSSAQFILLETFFRNSQVSWPRTYSHFRKMHEGLKHPPSGADLVSQIQGGFCYFQPKQNLATPLKWQFANLDFSLFKTSIKLATHEHLKDSAEAIESFAKSSARAQALALVQNAARAMVEKNSRDFVSAFASFATILQEQSLVAPETLELIASLRTDVGEKCVLAAKGCGALGADVICVLHTPENKARIHKFCVENQLLYLASSHESDDTGLEIRQM